MNTPRPSALRTSHYFAARRAAGTYARPWMQVIRSGGRSASFGDLAQTRACHCLAARRAARSITRLFEEHLRPHGLRATQFSALSELAQRGPTGITTLADILGLERTTMTRGAALLQRNGWVEPARSDNSRERPLRITAEGLRTLHEALPAWETAQRIVDEWPGIHPGLEEWDAAQPRSQADSN